jgi:nucleoid-associated protein YgaU
MFSAMISRPLLLLLGFILAFGAGWAVYELRLLQTADAPPREASGPAPEGTAGEGGGAERSPEQVPATPPDVAHTTEGRGGPDSEVASPADHPGTARTSQPEAERLKAQVEQPGLAESVGRAPGETAQTEAPEARRQVETSSAREEPASATTGTAGSPPAPAHTEPPVTAGVAEPSASEDETPSEALPGGSAAAERSAPSVPAPQARAATELARERGSVARAPSGQSVATGSAAATRASEPGAPPPQPGEDEMAASAAPATVAEQVAPSPPAKTRAATDSASAVNEPGASAAPSPGGDPKVTDEPRPTTARVAETIRRAVKALFGGATDEPAAGGEEPEVAAVPDAMPARPTPDQGHAAADVEPGAAPSFDIVRVERDGQAVIAGRAAPGAEVELRSGDRTIDRVRADQRGEWVALPPEPLGAGVQELSVAARVENQPAVASEEVVVVAVPGVRPPQPAPAATAESPPPHPAQLARRDPSDEAFAVALPREGAGKGRILQAPGRISTDGALALEMLDYDEQGRIRLSGEADAGAALRIYVDNQPAGTTVVGPGGQWDAVLERTLTPGDYTLRLDQLGASGKPDARLETPFTRVSHPPIAGDVQVDYVIVQPGNSLWRIARRVLGEGMRYVHIYQANQGQIRDPDLIYPGQVFELPGGINPAG